MANDLKVGITLSADTRAAAAELQKFFTEINRQSAEAQAKAAQSAASAAQKIARDTNAAQAKLRITGIGADIGANTDVATKALERYRAKTQETAAAVNGLGANMRGLGPLVAGTFSIAGIAGFVKGVSDAGIAVTSLQRALGAATGSQEAAAAELAFVREEANRLGVEFLSLGKQYAAFANATRGTAVEGEKTRTLFQGITEAGVALGRSTEEINRALVAVSQIAGKGVVSMEELRGQLAEAIPGAIQIAADAITGGSVPALNELVASGELAADVFIGKLGPALRDQFSKDAAGATNTTQAAFARLKNAIVDLQLTFSRGGISDSLRGVANFLADVANKAKLAVAGIRFFGAGLGAFGKSVKDLLTGNFAGIAANFEALKDTVGAELDAINAEASAKADEARQADIDAKNARVAAQKEYRDALKEVYNAEIADLESAIDAQRKLYDQAVKDSEAAAKKQKDLAKTVREAFTAAGAGPAQAPTLSGVQAEIDKLRGASDGLKNLAGADALKAAEEIDKKIRDIVEAAGQLKDQGEGGLFIQGLLRQLDPIVAQVGAAREAGGQEQIDAAAAKLLELQELAKSLQAIKIGADTAEAESELLDFNARMQAFLEANPLVQKVVLQQAERGAAEAPDTIKKARGGMLWKPGSGTDGILMYGDHGEFFINRLSTAKLMRSYGPGFLDYLNKYGRIPNIPRRASGGLLARAGASIGPVPRASAAANAAPESAFTITVADRPIIVPTAAGVVDQLRTALARQRMKNGT